HSLSPALHAAAYRALGLEWQYEAVRVKEGTLRGFVDGLDESWRGLSVTMPLKREALAYVGEAHPVAVATRAVNTILLDGPRSVGFNTDVHGIVEALRGAGSESPERVRILGAGATAGSLLAALASLGVTRAEILARSVERAQGL